GLVLGGVALILLVIGGILIFGGGGGDTSNNFTRGRPSGPTDTPPSSTPETKPVTPPFDITNLLPNETEAVVSIPHFERLLSSTIAGTALNTPGSFTSQGFQARFGMPISKVKQVVIAMGAPSAGNAWRFSVLRSAPDAPEFKEETLKGTL